MRIGDHLVVGLRPGTMLDERDEALLRELRPVGVVLYRGNFAHNLPYDEWLSIHAELIASIRAAIDRARLLIAIDHEGGLVCRTPAPITRFASARECEPYASNVGRAMGRELASLGININFAPVLDVNSNPTNPVIGNRAFGMCAARVSEAGIAFMHAMELEGVIACGKHFPGHGDTKSDPHIELPILDTSIDQLRARELLPFKALIDAGIGMLMTSHILFRKMDSAFPATLSQIVSGLLREELGFSGTVISDDVGMRAMDSFFADPVAPARFLGAGNDLLMICSHWTDTRRARDFQAAVERGLAARVVTEDQLRESWLRTERLLRRTPQHEVRALKPEMFAASHNSAPLFEG